VRINVGFKWEPIALMLLVIGLGMWLVWGPTNPRPRPGSDAAELRVGNARGVVEITRAAPAGNSSEIAPPRFRVMLRDGFTSEELSEAEFRRLFGDAVTSAIIADTTNPIYSLFKITSLTSLIWVGIGLAGQAAFSGRMLLQWLVSEKKRESVIPASFWWLSLFGGVALFAYFVWRQDFVGVLGQSSGIVIYARNIRLIYKHRRRETDELVPESPAASAENTTDHSNKDQPSADAR
jgi:lipid-A-disaccharide synthase-like uncharacterized protein